MNLSTKLKDFKAGFLIVFALFLGANAINAQPTCDVWKPRYEDNPYCHPYDPDGDFRNWYGTGWDRDNPNYRGLCDYSKYGWGYWYESYTYYPYTRIDYIAIHEKGAPNPLWYWKLDQCEFFYASYIYIHGPAEEGGYGGWYPGNIVDPNKPGAQAGETWDPVELKLGKTYTLKFIANDYFSNYYYTHLYWDMDNDAEFDYRGDELLNMWYDRNSNRGYCSSINYGTVPYTCRNMVNGNDNLSCYRGYLYGGIYNFTYTNFTHYWKEYEFDIEVPGDGVVVGEPSRMRLKRVYRYRFDNPCQIYYEYGSGRNRYSYDYYGQIIDFDVIFGGIEVTPFPNEGTLTYANEEYNDETRIPIIFQPNGDEVQFTKPEVEFVSPPSDILEMEYTIIGPRPSQTEVYRATNSTGGTRIKVDKNTLTTRQVEIPDPANPGQTILVDRFYWKAGYAGDYDPSSNGQYVKDANSILMTDGSFFTAQSGEYTVILNFFENNTPVEGAAELYYNFTVKTSYDMTVQKINDPKPVTDPWYETHILRSQKQVIANVKNIGLNPVNDFKVRYTIKGIDDNTKGVTQTGEFIYDDQNYGTLNVDDIFTVRFSKLFEGQIVGDYSVIVEVYDLDGEGPADKDQSHFNDYFPRPTGGSQNDGWEIADSYVIRFVYQHDLAAEAVLHPKAEPENDVERIYVNRPFRPMVRFANYGQQDLAQEVYASVRITKDSDGTEVAYIPDYAVELVPAGLRFNTRDVQFPAVTITEAGRYKIEAYIGSIFEDPAATLIGNNTIVDYFDVEEGMQGVFTVGTMNSGKAKNFETIEDAMSALYTLGVNGNITFELTDAKYEVAGNPAWDFTTTIVGLGYNPSINKTFTMTWKAAQNRAMIKGGVEIEMQSDLGYGVKFGQGLSYPSVENAAVNQSEDPNYINSSGYITFDGGVLKSLKFVMNSNDRFAAPFYLGGGSQNIALKNLIIENANEGLSGNSVRLPIIKGATTVGNIVEYTNDRFVDQFQNVNTYSAGIVNRGQLFNFEDPEVILPPKYDIEDIDTVSNKNIVIEGNEISGFGYGVVSIGMGGLYDVQKGRYVNYNGTSLKVNGNVISDVARAGIAIANEEMVEVIGNRISGVNLDNISIDRRYTSPTAFKAMEYDHAGIMIGGLIYQTEDRNGSEVRLKGMNAKDVLVDGNRVVGVQSDYFATGIKIEQSPVFYDANLPDRSILMPVGESNVRVVNNIIKDINGTSNDANRAGVHLFTQRENYDLLAPGSDQPSFRTTNDKIVNNTIIMGSSPNVVMNNGLIAGIGIQQATNTDVSNNIVVLDDVTISGISEVSSAVFVQGLYSKDGGPTLDFNAYYVNPASSGQLVRFIEMNPTNNLPKYSEYDLYTEEFENLEQWRIVSGSDRNSVEYNVLNDLDMSGNDVTIKLTNGLLPIGSPLNNRGKKSNWYNRDINGNERGLTGQRYDIGAIEFKGRQYTNDLQTVRISAPAAYRSTVPDPVTGVSFTDAEYIMTEGAIPVVAEIRNDGSMQQSEVELTMTIERMTASGTWSKEYEVVKTATIPSSNEGTVDFDMADGVGEDFLPKTYGDFNNDSDPSNDYVVDGRFVGMEVNVTPIYRITVESESDENNVNNVTSKEVRFYLRRTDRYLMLSTTDNQASFDNYDQGNNTVEEMDAFAGSMNTQVLRTALLSFNWSVNPNQGKYDYDVFDRNGWEKRSVNYDMYQTLIWSEGYDNNDGLNRFTTENIENFLSSGLDIFKKNLVIASEDMVRNLEQSDFVREVLRSEYEGNPVAGYYNETLDPELTGEGIANGTSFLVEDPSMQYLGVDDTDYYPMASGLKVVNGVDLSGTAQIGAYYDSKDDDFKVNGAAVATVTVTYNTLYFGLDWRHMGELTKLLMGVIDFIEENGAPIVPVELSEFNARQQGNKVALDWATSSEVNSSMFTIEKKDARTNLFTGIEEVSASGNTTEEKVYGPYYDYSVKYGNTYTYRLKMTDKDGTSSYSEERVVNLRGTEGTIEVVSVGPNPSRDRSELRLNLVGNMEITIELYDMTGSQVKTIYSGNQLSGESRYEINVNDLVSGSYHIVVRSGEIQIIEPLTVVK